jgi:uncharacterized membrane protein
MNHVTITAESLTTDQGSGPSVKAHVNTLHQMLAPFPVAYFTAAFVTDLAYWRTAEIMWERFSVWLIAGGLVMAALVAVAAIIDLIVSRQRPAWPRALCYALAVLLSLLNVFVHSRDGYTAIVPLGLTFSTIVVVILLFTSRVGWALTYPRRIGAN